MAAVTSNHGHGNVHSNSQTGFLAFDLLITQKSEEIHKSQCAEVEDTLRKQLMKRNFGLHFYVWRTYMFNAPLGTDAYFNLGFMGLNFF